MHDPVAHLVQVGAALGEISFRAELLAHVADQTPHCPFRVQQLLADQSLRTLQQRRVVRHQPVRVQDGALLAFAEASPDL